PVILFRNLACLGAAATHAGFPLLLPAASNPGLPRAGLCVTQARHARLAAVGLCRDRRRKLRRHLADFGRVRRTDEADLQPPHHLPELDLISKDRKPVACAAGGTSALSVTSGRSWYPC